MATQLTAIRDGEYEKAIELAENTLAEKPEDIFSHFTLAQAYESLGQYERALHHAEICVSQLPTSFEARALAARSASELSKYDSAYTHAKEALMDSQDPSLPGVIKVTFQVLSYIPGLKGLRTINEAGVNVYVRQTMWLKEYVEWYEKNPPNK